MNAKRSFWVSQEPDDDDSDAAFQHGGNSFSEEATRQMERLVGDFGRMYKERNDALEEATRAHHQALLRVSLAAELRDDDLGRRIMRIGFLSEALALLVGVGSESARMLRQAAPMHTIGKIAIPAEVQDKSDSEAAADSLGGSRIALLQLVTELAQAQHERWDGTGYPGKMSGAAIPLAGRIVAVVDFFDSLTMDRRYHKVFSTDAVLSLMVEQRGLAFDPHIVNTFTANLTALVALRDHINQSWPSYIDFVPVSKGDSRQ